jgi:hypothetical protein
MHATLFHPHTVYPTVEAAEAIAAANAADDDGWEYRVVPDPQGSGKAIIKIYDEAGEFVGNL